MHILVIKRDEPGWSGSGRIAAFERLIQALGRRHTVEQVVAYRGARPELPPGAVGVAQVGPRAVARLNVWRAARSAVKRRRPDVVLSCGLVAPPVGPPVVAVVRDLVGTGWEPRPEVGRLLRRYKRIVVPSLEALRQLRAAGARSWQLRVVPDPIAIGDPGPPERCPDGTFCLVHPGRILPSKGQHLSVDAVSRLTPEEKARVHLHIVGPVADRRYHDHLRVAAAGQPISFHDAHDLAPWLRRADLVLYPTCLSEGLADMALHAQAHGRPVAFADLPGVRESLGGAGLPFAPEDAVALRATLREALARPDRLQDLGKRSQAWVAERYRWSALHPRWEEVLEGAKVGRGVK